MNTIGLFFKRKYKEFIKYVVDNFRLKQFFVVIATIILAISFLLFFSFKYEIFDFWFETPPGPINTIKVTNVIGETVEDQSYDSEQIIGGETQIIHTDMFKVFVVFDGLILKGENKGEMIRCHQELIYANNIYSEDRVKQGKKVAVYTNPTSILWKNNNFEFDQPDSTAENVIVSFVVGDSVEHTEVPRGATIIRPESPTKDGMTFFGWFNQGDEYFFSGGVNSNTVLTAVFAEDVTWEFLDYDRISAVIIFAIIFLLFLIVYGKYKGIMSALAVVFTFLGVFLVYIPAIIAGHNIYIWTLMISVYTIAVTVLLIVGANKKGLASAVACVVGVLLGALLTIILRNVLSLSGNTTTEEYRVFSRGIFLNTPIDMRALLFGAITIGTLGAVMDMGISMCSALKEISDESMRPSFKQTIKSGNVVGRDMIGTMSSTLILAYAGSALAFIVYLMSFVDINILMLREEIIIQIIQALIGCVVLISVVPIATITCALLYNRKKKETSQG